MKLFMVLYEFRQLHIKSQIFVIVLIKKTGGPFGPGLLS